ncbi:CoA-transferase [Cloacibacillus sp. An23]|uniref:acyl CoA:acetate/3-ketoacid CoA transferase n=1 Tax=Cloacibacillus sp. An23 TaxID=1965591 RepID=UPI000B372A73|nr:CoA-transferase [Cloacibacillus sp. An23]OUO95007.1 3-oxoacid CoA-transferase [Cloacibacillus sp. An23]
MSKVISSSAAISLIRDNSVIGIGGFGGFSAPDELLREMAKSYLTHGTPKGLHAVCGVSPGDLTEDGWGLSIIKAPGLLSSIYASHVGMPPAIGRAVSSNEIAGYTVPLGVYGHLLRAMAGKTPGVITRIGLHTFCDPRLEGCRVNELAKNSGREVVSLINIDGTEYLHYKPFRIDVCIIRGSYADEYGNVSLEEEALYSEQAAMAAAVHNNGGTVIVQVKGIFKRGVLDPRHVAIPGALVDYVVLAKPENHPQCYDGSPFRPELIGDVRARLDLLKPMALTPRKICGRRAASEIKGGSYINLGIGMPDSVADIANEEGISHQVTFSIETGVCGGLPVRGVGFGAAFNPEAILSITDTLDMYDGGVLDAAILGLGEADEEGNVNVSKFGTRCTGPGGFIDITQSTKKICFIGTFTAGKLEYKTGDGRLVIEKDAEKTKFRKKVQQVTFSARYAREMGQEVLYITERAVFRLGADGVELVERAPGVDVERDILARMDFAPKISPKLKLMDERIFTDKKMRISFIDE